jgi:putative hydrolase of the HAD superfamily
MIKALLIDADGVIINAEYFSIQYSRDFGIDSNAMMPFFNSLFQQALIGKADLKEIVQPYLIEWKWRKSIDEFLDYWFKAENKINKPLIEVVKNIQRKGIKCYIATNQEKYRTQYMMEHMGFDKLFDGIFSSAHIGHIKPQKEFYQSIIKKLSLPAEQILFWDDTPSHINGAKKSGIQAELYTSFDDFKLKMSAIL